jgi:hypothetical protein
MSVVLQVTVVAFIVAACATYSIWRLLSGAARQRTLDLLARIPAVARMGWFVGLQARTRARLGGGGCGSCSASTTAASRKQTPGALPR